MNIQLISIMTGGAALIGSVTGGWIYVDDRFEHKATSMSAHEQIEMKIAAVDMDSEQQQIQLRLDIMEDRVWREKKADDPDVERIDRWKNQMERLEKRYDLIDQKRMR